MVVVMRRTASIRLVVTSAALCLVAALWPVPTQGQNTDIAVVAHPQVATDNLSLAELRKMLLGDREFWTAGQRITLLIRAPVARERDAAVQTICKMTEAQFRQHWIGKVFRAETPSGPKIVYSAAMAVDQVAHTPGAITFVEAAAVPKGARVLKIDGLSPGQPGYKLR
jgi:ABC-type phosphate transport system substrate-binding protein